MAHIRSSLACSLLLVASGCGAFGNHSNSAPPTSCGPGTHAVNSVCEEDPALAIATGGGSYWRAYASETILFQLSASSVSGTGLCTFANSNAYEPPNTNDPTGICNTPQMANALTMLSNIRPNQIPTPTSFTADVTSYSGTLPAVMFTLVSGDPGATRGITPQSISWSEGTTIAAITIDGCPYFDQTTCQVMSN